MKGYTPAYFLIPAQPGKWLILATLPESGEDDAPERPYLMVRPFGKGLVIVLSLDPWFSIPCTISNILMNREELFKPEEPAPEKAVPEKENGQKVVQPETDQKKSKKTSDKKKSKKKKSKK